MFDEFAVLANAVVGYMNLVNRTRFHGKTPTTIANLAMPDKINII